VKILGRRELVPVISRAVALSSVLLVLSIPLSQSSANAAATAITATTAKSVVGGHGEILTASATTHVKAGQAITVSGKGFDTTVGIYVELCQVVPSGVRPSICGGGVNMSGSSSASFWISSNAPSYGKGLAIPFKKGGSFSVILKVQPKIGSVDCRKAICAIYVRADHLRTQDRSHDIKLPLGFIR